MSALFSPCGTWRYRLDRMLGMFGPPVGFCLHNPSKAGADNEDPTSRRGIGYGTAWGCSRLTYINPWAGCATDPADLWRMDDPVGPENDRHIAEVALEIAKGGGFMVAAWGAVSPPARLRASARARLNVVEAIIRDVGCELRALGLTAAGDPRHPLYLRADAQPEPWTRRVA